MFKDITIEEYYKYQYLKTKIKKIKNYKNYFLIDDISLCYPETLTVSDLQNYNKLCGLEKEIPKESVNKNINQLMALNMPYGGINLSKYLSNIYTKNQYRNINNKLVDLISYGVVPMNKIGIYHCDIKNTNMLVNKNNKVQLIDWGLSFSLLINETKEKKYKRAINNLLRRPLQFNLPVSAIIYDNSFMSSLKDFLENNKTPTFFHLKTFVTEYIINMKVSGHMNYIKKIFLYLFIDTLKDYNIYEKNPFEKYKDLSHVSEEKLFNISKNSKQTIDIITYTFISNYITNILFKYTHNNVFQLMDYTMDVYLVNIDVYGVIVCYVDIFKKLIVKFKSLDKNGLILYKKLKTILLYYLFENSTEPFNFNELTKLLKDLNNYITFNF
jgi:serine/threonine protein kinase